MTQQTAKQTTTSEHPVRDAVRQVVSDSASVIRNAKDAVKERMKKPTTTAAITGAAVMGAVLAVGILETAVGGAAAWMTYRLVADTLSATASHALTARAVQKEQAG